MRGKVRGEEGEGEDHIQDSQGFLVEFLPRRANANSHRHFVDTKQSMASRYSPLGRGVVAVRDGERKKEWKT
jgi:hypothetical protein